MPDRIVRAGILSSESVNTLSWGAEVFYRRLMSVADDFGRYDGREPILRASLYPLVLSRVRESDIVTWIGECRDAGLVRLYSCAHKPYLEIVKFDQRKREGAKSRWPEPPDCATAGASPQVAASSGESPPIPKSDSVIVFVVDPPLPPKGFDEFWAAYPKKKAKGDALKAWVKLKPPLELILKALTWQMKSKDWQKDGGQFIPFPATYLRNIGWLDEPDFMKEFAPKTAEWILQNDNPKRLTLNQIKERMSQKEAA